MSTDWKPGTTVTINPTAIHTFGPAAETLTKEEWLKRCAARFAQRCDLDEETAAKHAAPCWDNTVNFEGSEEAALDFDPEEAAEIEMSHWGD